GAMRSPPGVLAVPVWTGQSLRTPAQYPASTVGRRSSPRAGGKYRDRNHSAPSGAGSSDGGGRPRNAASPAATRTSSSHRPYYRHVATTVSSHSANRLPASLS